MNLAVITRPLHKVVKYSKHMLVKHSADILTGFTVGGVVLTGFEVHKATLKADEFLRVNGYDMANPETQKVLKLEAAKFYIRPAITGAVTIGSAIGANYINHKEIAGWAALCTATETALNENRDKIEELMGAKALNKIDEEIVADKGRKIMENNTNDSTILDTGTGNVLCVDTYWTGQKFLADPNLIWSSQNTYNERLIEEGEAGCGLSSGEFLEELWKTCPNAIIPKRTYDNGYRIGTDQHATGLLQISAHWEGDPKKNERYLAFGPANKPTRNYSGF